MMNELETEILKVLSKGERQTPRTILSELKSRGMKTDQSSVRAALRNLQLKKEIEKKGASWKAVKYIQDDSVVTRPTVESIYHPTGVKDSKKKTSLSKLQTTKVQTTGGRWSTFRRLCAYYTDCVLLSERPTVTAFKERQNDSWIQITQQVPWRNIQAGKPFSILLEGDELGIQKTRTKQGTDICLFLGYPIQYIVTKDKKKFSVPIFVQAFDVSGDISTLNLEPSGPLMINTAWLENQFRNYEERQNFLELIGLKTSHLDEDFSHPEMSIEKLAVDMSKLLRDKVKETILPGVLNTQNVKHIKEAGIYNRALLICGSKLVYTKSLIRELKTISAWPDEDLDKTALAHIFPHEESKDNRKADPVKKSSFYALSPNDIIQMTALNKKQIQAVEYAINAPISVVTGPPGSGKSVVVRSILINQTIRSKSALFASKNHQALDAVEPTLNKLVSSGPLMIRAASKDITQRNTWKTGLKEILSQPEVDNKPEKEQAMFTLCDTIEKVTCTNSLINELMDIENKYSELNHAHSKLEKEIPQYLLMSSCDTIEDVHELENKIQLFTKDRSSLIERIKRYIFSKSYRKSEELIITKLKEFPEPETGFPGLDPTQKNEWEQYFKNLSLFIEYNDLKKQIDEIENSIKKNDSFQSLNKSLDNLLQLAQKSALKVLSIIAIGQGLELSAEDRETLANIRSAVANLGDTRFMRMFAEHFHLILNNFPLWAVSNLSVKSALPLLPAIFDLVVIDEASQCDGASVIPLFARAKRICIVGDPLQLSHICTLSKELEKNLLEAHLLTDLSVQRFTYKENSCFDVINSSSKVENARTLLSNHYRCHPEIAQFVNEQFYKNALNIVTITEKLNIPSGQKPGLHWSNVEGNVEKATSGSVCTEEAEFIINKLKELEKSGYYGTIGVVTPFKHQADKINDLIYNELGKKFILETSLQAGTAHVYQGSERDLIFFSLCCGPDMPKGSEGFISKEPNLFNVAVTRAKAILHIVGNKNWAMDCSISFIRQCAITHDKKIKIPEINDDIYESPWEKVLSEALLV